MRTGIVIMATRLSPSHHGVHFVCDSIEKTMRKSPHSCQIWEARCHDLFADVLGLPTIWIPHSYADCGQYRPDEHASLSVTRKVIMKMTGIFLDIGECASARGCHGGVGYRRRDSLAWRA